MIQISLADSRTDKGVPCHGMRPSRTLKEDRQSEPNLSALFDLYLITISIFVSLNGCVCSRIMEIYFKVWQIIFVFALLISIEINLLYFDENICLRSAECGKKFWSLFRRLATEPAQSKNQFFLHLDKS